MKKVKLGLAFGLAFGLIDALLMLPIPMTDKVIAILGASINRFAIGWFIPVTNFPKPGWMRGLMIGTLISLPDAIITKAYLPILIIGALGGVGLGLLSDRLIQRHS
ncbi:MAG: hypothetical protein ABIJ03_02225 [Patescibacteria group bacterium]|nr:hypothetical protein [Patescibacteria group bacterium]